MAPEMCSVGVAAFIGNYVAAAIRHYCRKYPHRCPNQNKLNCPRTNIFAQQAQALQLLPPVAINAAKDLIKQLHA